MTDLERISLETSSGPNRRDIMRLAGLTGASVLASAVLPKSVWAKKSGKLHVGLNARDMGALHPHVATGSNDTPVIDAIYSGLVRYKPTEVSMEAVEPDLAENWTASEDRKTFTFNLRKGVKWHKGYGEVTSEDIKYSLTWVRDNPQSTFKPLYTDITNIDTPDKYTVIISLKSPNPTFLTSVANWHGGFVICKKAMEELGDRYKSAPIGSGPFQFKSYKPKESVTVSANPDYYAGKPKLDQVIFSYIPDQTSRRFAFVQQEVDIIQAASDEDWLKEVVKSTPGKPAVDLLGPAKNVALHMKRSVKPLDNVMVRKAIAHAINRQDYVDYFGRIFQPTYAVIPPGYFGSLPKDEIPADLIYDFNPDKAKKILTDAGFGGGIELETVVSERNDYLALAQIGQEQLSKIGITLKLNVLDHGSWVAAIIKEKRGSLVWSTSSRFPSAESLIREFWLCSADVTKPTGVQNFAEYCNPKLDEAYQAGINAIDPAVRKEHFQEVQRIELQDLPTIPLGAMATPAMRQDYVDLGYPVDGQILSLPYMYHLTEKTTV